MKGNIVLNREVLKHPIVSPEYNPLWFSAWVWMLLQARWKSKEILVGDKLIKVGRGQLLTSYRFMSKGTGLSVQQIRTFLSTLKKHQIINTTTNTGQTLITICNYNKYQLDKNKSTQEATSEQHSTNTAPTQNIIPDVIPDEKKDNMPGYFFKGEVVRLNERDYKRWKETYFSIPDFDAALQAADDWIRGQREADQKRWFHVISGMLGNKHQKFIEETKGGDNWLV